MSVASCCPAGRPLNADLLYWLDDPRAARGVYVLDGPGWTLHPYPDLADRARGISQQLRARGVGSGIAVGLAADGLIDFMCGLFGVLHAGGTVVPVSTERASETVASAETRRRLHATSAGLVAMVSTGPAQLRTNRVHGVPTCLLEDRRVSSLDRVGGPDPALVQFTSGSSGHARGLRITADNLAANTSMIAAWLEIGPDDAITSWLPLLHDMGLVGTFLTSVAAQINLWQLTPAQFLKQPARWLECFGRHGATIGAAPAFGYGYLGRRVRQSQVAGMDFSAWHSAIVGAERLSARTLGEFVKLLTPYGFHAAAVRPAYGLAEATLAVAGHPLRSGAPHVVRLERTSLALGAPVRHAAAGELGLAHAEGDGSLLCSSGGALPGAEVTIVGEDGAEVPDETLGEIVVRGRSVAAGYTDGGAGESRVEGGVVHTGDAGFVSGGELFVLGRMGDAVKVRGRLICVEGLEAAISEVLGLPTNRIAVVARDTDAVDVVIETQSGELAATDGLGARVRACVGPSLEVTIWAAAPGSIPRTTSGKPRRRKMWQLLQVGALDASPLSGDPLGLEPSIGVGRTAMPG